VEGLRLRPSTTAALSSRGRTPSAALMAIGERLTGLLPQGLIA